MFAWALNTPVYNLHPFKKDAAIILTITVIEN